MRGVEIQIAVGASMYLLSKMCKKVRGLVILLSWQSLIGSRGVAGLKDFMTSASLVGGIDNLVKYQETVHILVTRMPKLSIE